MPEETPRLFDESRHENDSSVSYHVDLPDYVSSSLAKIPNMLLKLGYGILPEGRPNKKAVFIMRKPKNGGIVFQSRGIHIYNFHSSPSGEYISVDASDKRKEEALKIVRSMEWRINEDARRYEWKRWEEFLKSRNPTAETH